MTTFIKDSPKSAFKLCSLISFPKIEEKIESDNGASRYMFNMGFLDYLEKQALFQEFNQASVQHQVGKDYVPETDSSDNVEHTSLNSQTSISQKLTSSGVKKRKNKEETKQDIQEKQKDQGRGGNCIASNITKTLFRVIEYRLSESVNQKFMLLTQRYHIKSQKENTIILSLILYDLVKTGEMSFDMFENIFCFFMKSLNESKDNCEKKMSDQPQRRGFHSKNRKMYVNFIKINAELYSLLKVALKSENPVRLNLKSISDIISDTYDRKQRQIEKAISKIKSIILNHPSLQALFGHEQNDIEGTLFEAVDYAFRRNLEKRCIQTKRKIQRFFYEIQQSQPVQSEEERFFMCYLGLKLAGEKEQQIWQEFIKSSNLKRQYNQTKQEEQKLFAFLKNEIPEMLRGFEFNNLKRTSLQTEVKMEEETQPELGMQKIYQTYLELKNSIDF